MLAALAFACEQRRSGARWRRCFCLKAASGAVGFRTVRAEVRGWWNDDDVEGRPAAIDPDDCCVLIKAYIGPAGGEGEEYFNFTVCTPSALDRRLDRDNRPYWARATLVVRRYSKDAVDAALNQFVHSISGSDWTEVAMKLNRFLHWEFEDYRE